MNQYFSQLIGDVFKKPMGGDVWCLVQWQNPEVCIRVWRSSPMNWRLLTINLRSSVSCIVLVDMEIAGLISPSLTCPWAKHFIPKICKHSVASRLQSYLQQRPRGRHNTHYSLSAKVAKATVQRRALRLQYVPFLFFSPLHLGRRREWDRHGNKRHTPFIPIIPKTHVKRIISITAFQSVIHFYNLQSFLTGAVVLLWLHATVWLWCENMLVNLKHYYFCPYQKQQ